MCWTFDGDTRSSSLRYFHAAIMRNDMLQVASLPLLCSYSGTTVVVVPLQLRPVVAALSGTPIGFLTNLLVTIDSASQGAIVDLG